MKSKKTLIYTIVVLIALAMVSGLALADDSIIFRRNISKTPDMETEKAAIYMMDFYVPAQNSAGEVKPIDNYCLWDGTTQSMGGLIDEDGTCLGDTVYEARDYAKPLISVYIDGEPVHSWFEESGEELGIAGGLVLGAFDAYVGVSLDDGTSWRRENLSRSADLSSFIGTDPGINQGLPFPGGVHALVHQVAEDKILAVWASKYCQSGFPLYSLLSDGQTIDYSDYLGDLESTYGKNALYLYDLFGVGGDQGSVDYTEQGWPEVGEVPYSCVWTARGKLLPGDDPKTTDFIEASHVVWMAPERLTSGVRDANLPAVDCAGGAGCALTWQEDPEGLRPGQGLGPGEGWSGAIANGKTDIWYSYITFADFDLVVIDDDNNGIPDVGEELLIEEYEALVGDQMDRPKPYVPMAMPVRLTDNDMCKATAGQNENAEDPYCWINFDNIDDLDITTIGEYLDGLTEPETDANFCASTAEWDTPGGSELDICVTRDGRWMVGRVASTRVRMAIKPYTPMEAADLDGDGFVEKSAWLSLAAEETKGLGITVPEDETYDPIDIGKDMFYYSFDYAKPYNLHVNLALDAEDPSPYIVQQGGMLNQPASCSPWFIPVEDRTHPDIVCEPYEIFEVQLDPITGYEYYLTEISRRFAITLNNIPNITNTEINSSGLAGMLIYKQGIINQGGPADIMLRRVVVPDDFDPAADNPFAYENMECTNPDGTSGWVYPTDVTSSYPVNPNYLKGVCMAPAINISGTTIVSCDAGEDNDTCAAAFPVADDGSIPDDLGEDQFPKVREWRNCDGGTTIDGCEDDNDLDDQTWENPYDMAKGHRGFLYGDMVMMMYAWSPNWKSNSVGNDHYNLYQRRSFDGGETWTTTPSDWCSAAGECGSGTSYFEYYYGEKIGDDFVKYLWEYGPGDFEQARNLSLLTGNKVTILDPRYSPPGGLKQYSTIRTDWLVANADLINFTSDDALPYTDDFEIDPSKYYMVYETGDNTTVDVGEAIPLDLYYSRATVFGDTYEFFDYINDSEDCIGEDGLVDWSAETCIQPRWPWLENAADDLSGEASVVLNPGGTFAYNVWNQWQEDVIIDEFGEEHEFVFDSDMIFRRLLWGTDLDEATVERAPFAYIIYISQTTVEVESDATIVLVGSGKDWSGTGIQGYAWRMDESGILGNEQRFTLPTAALTVGKHTIYFSVVDGNGKWSKEVPATIEVIDLTPTRMLFIPVINNH